MEKLTIEQVNEILKTTRDFSHKDLSGLDLHRMDFEDVNLSHANLERANLYNAEFSATNISYAKWENDDCKKSILKTLLAYIFPKCFK